MKRTILNRMVSTAAVIILPVAAFAQDNGADVNSGNQGIDPSLSPTGSTDMPKSGLYDTGSIPTGQSGQGEQAGTFSTGVIVKDGSAYVVHKLQNEMSLPDGSKIQPNGVIKNSDGSTRSMSSDQILSVDGRMMSSPFGMENTPGSSNSSLFNSSSTPGWSTGTGPATSITSPLPSGQPSNIPPEPSEPFKDYSGTSNPMPDDNNVNSSPLPDSSELNGGTPDVSQTNQSPEFTD